MLIYVPKTMGNNKSNTAIIVAIITVLGGILTAVITNWDKIFPEKPIAAISPPPTPTVAPKENPVVPVNDHIPPAPHPRPTEHLTQVRLSFQTEDAAGKATYYYNTPETKAQYIAQLSDHQNLYYSACELAQGAQASTCDPGRNWKKVAISLVGCTSVESCSRSSYGVSDISKQDALSHLKLSEQ